MKIELNFMVKALLEEFGFDQLSTLPVAELLEDLNISQFQGENVNK